MPADSSHCICDILLSSGIRCPALVAPEHGNMTGDSFTFKDVVEFGCKEGYLLTGSAVRECLNTGDWDGVASECKRTYRVHCAKSIT